jgi:hypothetical protein
MAAAFIRGKTVAVLEFATINDQSSNTIERLLDVQLRIKQFW